MPKTEKYQGWANYETWAVKLWIDNEEGNQRYWSEVAQETWEGAKADKTFTRKERANLDLADRLKSEHEGAMAEVLEGARVEASVWADLLGAALSEVDWGEIADSMLEDAESE